MIIICKICTPHFADGTVTNSEIFANTTTRMSRVRCQSLEATVTGDPWAGQAVSDGSSRISQAKFKLDSQGESDWDHGQLEGWKQKLSQGITC